VEDYMSEIFENGYAVVIGIDSNKIPRLALEAVAKDVTAVHDVLIHPERCAYSPDNVKLLQGEESTGKNILEAIFWLKEKVQADPQATAVIYYSGHGMRDKKTEQYYLIPYDIQSLSRLRIDALKAETITAEISEIQAKRTLVVLDCCHAQGMKVKDVDLDGGPELDRVAFPDDLPETKAVPAYESGGNDLAELAEGDGRAILNSSTGAESSYVRPDRKMSVFTYHFIEALTGHAPHGETDTVVYVTDVMSWVTRRVKETVAQMGRSQTPVMRTSGVFPVAQLIGGKGVALSKGELAPDPLEPLPEASVSVVGDHNVVAGDNAQINQAGGDMAGGDIVKKEGGVHFGEGDVTVSGPVAGGDQQVQYGDVIHGSKSEVELVDGDKIDANNISGSTVAMGRGSRVEADVRIQHGGGSTRLDPLFVPLQSLVAGQAPEMVGKVNALKTQVEMGSSADDTAVANLIQDIADAVPASKSVIVALFANPQVSMAAGNNSKFVLGRIS
jgi:hypothetical protein